ncbi:MAG TPA: hypothetical protein VD757_01890, partial [Candidatus Nitrosocosmicus sp.]|nr:hypothetical protein [Candidatus Nitrosocosmicus sp.]
MKMKMHIKRLLVIVLVLCLAINGSICPVQADANTGLVAHYKFDGDLKDSSGKGNDGSPEGNGITYADAKFGKGAKFDGATYITV